MLKLGNSLKRRLIITGTILLVLVLIASVVLFFTARQYNFYIERSIRAQQVYASFRAVSDHTHRKLSALGEIVAEGSLINLQERYRNQEALRAALKDVRENIAAELTHVGDVKEASELDHFNKIELLAEEIIRGSEDVREAVNSNDEIAARAALSNIRGPEVEGDFIRMIDEALAEELRDVQRTQVVAQDLNTLLTRLLSLIFLSFIVLGAILLYATWRALSRSLKVFEHATSAYQDGDFSYRVPADVEQEFGSLALALNQMASEVEAQRQRERTTQENLEAIIDNRTRELTQTNEKLNVVSEARKQFLADISHELRTPLTIMQGEADFALRGDNKTAEQYIDALRRVKEQTIHTTRFVQDLLFVARAEDGKAPIHRRPVAIAPLVADICEDFDIISAEKGIKIQQSIPKYDLVVNIDAARIKQVITILIDNALRYSYNNSTIEVRVNDQEQSVSIEVKDTGIGLKYNEASQVFSRFYRGSEGSGKASGTGLGLPVAKAIIDSHGGSISLRGEEGSGTTATVSLPLEVRLRAVK